MEEEKELVGSGLWTDDLERDPLQDLVIGFREATKGYPIWLQQEMEEELLKQYKPTNDK